MTYICDECRHQFEARREIDSREETYQGNLYEPDTIYCPECGSDTVTERS